MHKKTYNQITIFILYDEVTKMKKTKTLCSVFLCLLLMLSAFAVNSSALTDTGESLASAVYNFYYPEGVNLIETNEEVIDGEGFSANTVANHLAWHSPSYFRYYYVDCESYGYYEVPYDVFMSEAETLFDCRTDLEDANGLFSYDEATNSFVMYDGFGDEGAQTDIIFYGYVPAGSKYITYSYEIDAEEAYEYTAGDVEGVDYIELTVTLDDMVGTAYFRVTNIVKAILTCDGNDAKLYSWETVDHIPELSTMVVEFDGSVFYGWDYEDGNWYYYNKDVKVRDSFIFDGYGFYYLDEDGVMLANQWFEITADEWIYFDESGALVSSGWVEVDGDWYYIGEEGTRVSNQWVKDSKGWCYLGYDGKMVTNGWAEDSVGYCYLGADGYMITNKWIHDGVGWSYQDASGHSVCNKWIKDSVGWCYTDEVGYMVTNGVVPDSYGLCYVNESGYIVYNQWIEDSEGYKYYVNANGYVGKNQWVLSYNYDWYYVDANSRTVKNRWMKDSQGWCYLGADGKMITHQWMKDSYGWCYLGWDGRMVTNTFVEDSVGICYVGSDGYMVTNKWMQDDYGWFYVDAGGHIAFNKWVKDSVGWCYIGEDGYCITNDFVADSHGVCYLNAEGRMVISNWVAVGDDLYYLDENGYVVTGSYIIDGDEYLFDETGRLL